MRKSSIFDQILNTMESTDQNEEYDELSYHDSPFEVINKSSDLLNYDYCDEPIGDVEGKYFNDLVSYTKIEHSNDVFSDNERASQQSSDEDFANEPRISITRPFSKSFKIRTENRMSSFVDHTYLSPREFSKTMTKQSSSKLNIKEAELKE